MSTPRTMRIIGFAVIAVGGASAVFAAVTWWQTLAAFLIEIAAFTSWAVLTKPAQEQ